MPAEQRIRILTPEQAVSDITTPASPIGTALSSTVVNPALRRMTADDMLSALFNVPLPPDDRPTVVWSSSMTSSYATPVLARPAIVGTGVGVVWNSFTGTPDPLFHFDPGVFSTSNGGAGDLEMHGDGKPGGASQAANWNLAFEFVTTSTDAFELSLYDTGSSGFVLEVNGIEAGFYQLQPGLAAGKKATVTFPRAGIRHIRISGLQRFREVMLKSGANISKPTFTRRRGAIIGDSYVNGSGGVYNAERGTTINTSFAPRLLRALGSTSDVLAGIGGTGFVAGGTESNYLSRVSAVLGFQPSFLVLTGSINDNSTGTGVQAGVEAVLNSTASVADRFVATVTRKGWEGCNAAIRAGVTAHGQGVRVISVDGILDGTGNTQSGGTGMQGLFNMTDNSHPSYEGHEFILRQMVRAYFETARSI